MQVALGSIHLFSPHRAEERPISRLPQGQDAVPRIFVFLAYQAY